jgi:hypothetical protein
LNDTTAIRHRTAQNGALDRAYVQASLGNVPTLIATEVLRDALRETYRVLSRTVEGQSYHVDLLVDRRGVVTTNCDCPAASTGKCCWHRGAARLAHADAIRCETEVGYRIRHKAQPITAAMLSGKA